ncbi:MAG: calcium-binding EGF-like domain-containing protein [Bacteroidota bacterium]
MKFSRLTSFLFGLVVVAFLGLQGCADPCADITCENGGTCVEGTCNCADGFEGTTCETEIRGKFIASYSATETCANFPGQTFNSTLVISASNAGPLKVVITNIYSNGWSIVADVVDNTLSFTSVDIAGVQAGATVKATGTGTLAGDVLTMNYTVTEGAVSDNCQLTGSKQ